MTHREAEVLRELLAGRSNKEIAHDLGISVRTAEVHRANVMAKARARGLAGLIKIAVAADPAQLQGLLGTGTEAYREHKAGSALAASEELMSLSTPDKAR
ncbi:MAG: LuxR C-terminal-related transcriptional regulator [Methylocystis sp.]|uniref:LuxR C-terminal-related transcriptional regulator n=1 Tax=Methylocystis sp. TaxID=1911079 RepID=UPI003DA571D5